MNAQEEIYQLLTSDQAISQINGNKVWYLEAEQTEMPSYIVYGIDKVPIRTKDGIAGWTMELNVTTYNNTNELSMPLGNAVVNALEKHTGENIRQIQVVEISPDKDIDQGKYINTIKSILTIK